MLCLKPLERPLELKTTWQFKGSDWQGLNVDPTSTVLSIYSTSTLMDRLIIVCLLLETDVLICFVIAGFSNDIDP